ncbi:MAG TPA: hypothetical protein VHH88_08480, partial [Verrucomicrobiae bacterium]|nr:hypothetical protein [Verrucomicrobiae bacterium]
PSNLVAVPLCALVLISNLASLLLAWWPAAAAIFNHAGWALMWCIAETGKWFAAWPKAYAYVAAPGMFSVFLFYALFLAIVTGWAFRPRLRALKISALIIALAFGAGLALRDYLTPRLTVLPLNQSSAAFFDAPGSRDDLLINCGDSFAAQFTLKPFLRAQGVNRLGNFLLTHGESHAMGGAEGITALFDPARIWISPIPGRSRVYREFARELAKAPRKLASAREGARAGIWEAIHPSEADHFSRAEDNAVVLASEVRGTRVLLLPELGRAGQNALLDRRDKLRADIVIASMPGDGEPLIEPLLDAIQPRLIVIANTQQPVSRRPSRKLRRRLETRAAQVIYTAEAGAVTLRFRNGGWEARAMNGWRLASETLDGRTPGLQAVAHPL